MNMFPPEIIEKATLREPIVLGENEKVFTEIDTYDKDIYVTLHWIVRNGKVIVIDINRKFLP